MRPSHVLFLQILAWWICNNLFALHTQALFRSASAAPLLYLDVTFYQIALGFLSSHLLLHFLPSSAASPAAKPAPAPFLSFLISVAHLLGATLTNLSYRALGATATLVWKLSEPLTTTLLKFLLLNIPTPLPSFLGLQIILSGVLLFSTSTYTISALSPILLANIAFPIRNVALKKEQLLKPHHTPSPLARFHALYLQILPVSLFLFLLKYITVGARIVPDVTLLENAMLFNGYQLASFFVLARLDSLTHSVANTLKRFSGILLAALYTQETLSGTQFMGLFLTFCGFPLYVFGKGLSVAVGKMKNGGVIRSGLFVVVVVVSVLVGGLILPGGAGSGSEVERKVRETISSVVGLGEERGDVEKGGETRWALEGERIIHVDPKYRQVENLVVRSYEEAKGIDDGDNTGNYIWQHAAFVSLPDFSAAKTCNESRMDCLKKHVDGTEKKMVTYRPGANYFSFKRPGAFAWDIEGMEDFGTVPLLFGIGVQAYFTNNSIVVDIFPGRPIETRPEDFEFTELAKNLLTLLQVHQYPMLFRGDFTLAAARHVGYKHGISVGCPSLFLSENTQLGRTLESKYRALERRIGDTSLKVGINIKEGERFQALFRRLLDRYPNSYVYTQGKGDMAYLEALKIPFERVRLFTNVEAWKASIGEMDVSIGARIHGNMIALSAGVPVLVLAPDHRVLEMVQRMKVPHMGFFDEQVENWTDVAKVVSGAQFDGAAFDNNRCEIAKLYQHVFEGFGVAVQLHVRQIAELC